jgi:hypothetical protein
MLSMAIMNKEASISTFQQRLRELEETAVEDLPALLERAQDPLTDTRAHTPKRARVQSNTAGSDTNLATLADDLSLTGVNSTTTGAGSADATLNSDGAAGDTDADNAPMDL